MKTRITSLLVCCLAGILPGLSLADGGSNTGRYHGVMMDRGTVISVGRVDPTEDISTGFFVDANYTSVALNGGVALKRFGNDSNPTLADYIKYHRVYHRKVYNAYAGIGFSRIIQLQYGYGNEKGIFRVRSDINARAIMDFLSQKSTPKSRMTLGDRLTFSFAVERYLNGSHDVFDNATWGVGLLF